LNNMKYTAEQYAQALMESLEGTSPSDQENVLDNFVKILAENNEIRNFESIAEEFHKLELGKQGIKQVQIQSAHPLNRENEKEILDELNKLVKGKLEVKKKINEDLIGGVVIQLEDKVIDASIKHQLEQLKEQLTK